MDSKETRRQQMTRVAQELSTELRSQVRGRWKGVRTAQRNEEDRHVWRFQSSGGGTERFLHIEHGAMVKGKDAPARLLELLETGRWLDRLHTGPEKALLLSSDGRLAAYPQSN